MQYVCNQAYTKCELRFFNRTLVAVSYTHLDVYKRQLFPCHMSKAVDSHEYFTGIISPSLL